MRPRPALAAALAVAGLVALGVAVDFLVRHPAGRQIPQARANLAVVDATSFSFAIERYPKYWPPLYPALLTALDRLGIPADRVNAGLYTILLALFAVFLRRIVGWGAAAAAVLLLATQYASLRNVFQITAETLFTLEAFLLLLLLGRRGAPSVGRAALVGLLAGLAMMTRYFGAFWPTLPALVLLVAAPGAGRDRVRRALAAGAVAVLVTAPWLLHVRSSTGHLTGADRRDAFQTGELAQWNEYLGLRTNVAFTGKTLILDWLSPSRFATHRAVNDEPVTRTEWGLSAVAAVLLGAGVAIGARRRGRTEVDAAAAAATAPPDGSAAATSPAAPPPGRDPRPVRLPALFAASYLVGLVAVWSVTKNDPIYTRFVFPAYPFLAAALFLAPRGGARQVRARLPFLLLYVLCLGASLLRHARAPAAPDG